MYKQEGGSVLLEIKNLTIVVKGTDNLIVNRVSMKVSSGESVALVGGSGSGKSTTGFAAMGLLDPALMRKFGEIFWKDKSLRVFTEQEMRAIRGSEIAMVFQEPLNAFDPVFTIGDQIAEVLRCQGGTSKNVKEKVFALLHRCEVKDAARVAESYPHQLSGGLRQRAMIALALAGKPSLIIADEPTSSLDVTVQARILTLVKKLRQEKRVAFLWITHDLMMAKMLADRVYVMNEGCIVEHGRIQEVFEAPQHEYTQKLLKACR